MTLGTEVVDFVRLSFLHYANQVASVSQIAVVQLEVSVINVRCLIDMVYALGIKKRGATFDTVDDIAFV